MRGTNRHTTINHGLWLHYTSSIAYKSNILEFFCGETGSLSTWVVDRNLRLGIGMRIKQRSSTDLSHSSSVRLCSVAKLGICWCEDAKKAVWYSDDIIETGEVSAYREENTVSCI